MMTIMMMLIVIIQSKEDILHENPPSNEDKRNDEDIKFIGSGHKVAQAIDTKLIHIPKLMRGGIILSL